MKRKILWCSEFSGMNTGFSKISKEILSRIKGHPEIDIIEYAAYINGNDPRVLDVPWPVYGSIPDEGDPLLEEYHRSIYGQFGETLFEKVLLQTTPDICVSISDQWMASEWQSRSPFRKYFKYIYMPTVDGRPQVKQWMHEYQEADCLLTYTQFGKDTIEKESNNTIKVFDVVRPAVNEKIFRPLDKKAIRKSLGIGENQHIVMMASRNQKRKLFPNLFSAFADYLELCKLKGDLDKYNNTYLFIHSSYPDVGWDFASHLIRTGIGHRTYFTYCCKSCKFFKPQKFQGEICVCPNCGQYSFHMPNTNNGVSDENLAVLYNIADLHVQYTICEGLSCTTAEAKACEVPCFATDYSAVAEQVAIKGCSPIKVKSFTWESEQETSQARAIPDDNDLVDKMYHFFCSDKEAREEWGRIARQDIIDNYTYDRAAKIFINAIMSLKPLDRNKTWFNKESQLIFPHKNPPENLDNKSFLDWCLDYVLHEPNRKNSPWYYKTIQALNSGHLSERNVRKPFSQEHLFNESIKIVEKSNFFEKQRMDMLIGAQKPPTMVLV